MPVYTSAEQLYEVLGEVFERLRRRPEHMADFTGSNLVVRMRFTDPAAEVLLDGRHPALEVFFGPRPGRADLELSMSADLLHDIWTGRTRLREAFFRGQIQTKGNVFRAMKLADLFRAAEETYPQVLAEKGFDNIE